MFWRPFLVLTLQNNNRHNTSERAHKIFPIPNMRPRSMREPPPWLGGTGVLPPALFVFWTCQHGCSAPSIGVSRIFSERVHFSFPKKLTIFFHPNFLRKLDSIYCTLPRPGGALTTFPCKFGLQFFSPPWRCMCTQCTPATPMVLSCPLRSSELFPQTASPAKGQWSTCPIDFQQFHL